MIVKRWRRYGNDRLYVSRDDGTKLGWWDLAAENGHPEHPSLEGALADAVSAWRGSTDALPATEAAGRTGSNKPVRAPRPEQEPRVSMSKPEPEPEPEPQPEWRDLADNRAGAEARKQAKAAWDAAPIRSALGRAFGVHTEERRWRVGADGEEKVAAQFEKAARADPRWRFIHAIPVGDRGSDIDHVAIGPGGVFTLNTKHHPKAKIWAAGNTLMVNGTSYPYIPSSRHEASRAAKLLTTACGFDVPVSGVVVPVKAASVKVKGAIDDVDVISASLIAKWLLTCPRSLAEEKQDAIYEAARMPTTWRKSA